MKPFLFIIALFSLNLFAEIDTSDLSIPDEIIDSPTIDLEGQLAKKVEEKKAPAVKKLAPKVVETPVVVEKKPLSSSERMRLYREQLEVRNQVMVQKKMEQIRLQQEIALARKLEQSMNQTLKALDSAMK